MVRLKQKPTPALQLPTESRILDERMQIHTLGVERRQMEVNDTYQAGYNKRLRGINREIDMRATNIKNLLSGNEE